MRGQRPTQFESVVSINLKLTAADEIRKYMQGIMLGAQQEILNAYGDGPSHIIKAGRVISITMMREFEQELKLDGDSLEKRFVQRQIALFYKAYRLLVAGVCESYENFNAYVTKLHGQARTAQEARNMQPDKRSKLVSPAEEILAGQGFQLVQEMVMEALANRDRLEHPKIAALLRDCENKELLQRPGWVIVNSVPLASLLARRLGEKQIRAAALTGKRLGNEQKHAQIASRLMEGKLAFVLSTSVRLAKWASGGTPAGSVICYHPPTTKADKLAVDGLAGIEGQLAFISTLVANNSPDCAFYFLRKRILQEAAAEERSRPKFPLQTGFEFGQDEQRDP